MFNFLKNKNDITGNYLKHFLNLLVTISNPLDMDYYHVKECFNRNEEFFNSFNYLISNTDKVDNDYLKSLFKLHRKFLQLEITQEQYIVELNDLYVTNQFNCDKKYKKILPTLNVLLRESVVVNEQFFNILNELISYKNELASLTEKADKIQNLITYSKSSALENDDVKKIINRLDFNLKNNSKEKMDLEYDFNFTDRDLKAKNEQLLEYFTNIFNNNKYCLPFNEFNLRSYKHKHLESICYLIYLSIKIKYLILQRYPLDTNELILEINNFEKFYGWNNIYYILSNGECNSLNDDNNLDKYPHSIWHYYLTYQKKL